MHQFHHQLHQPVTRWTEWTLDQNNERSLPDDRVRGPDGDAIRQELHPVQRGTMHCDRDCAGRRDPDAGVDDQLSTRGFEVVRESVRQFCVRVCRVPALAIFVGCGVGLD